MAYSQITPSQVPRSNLPKVTALRWAIWTVAYCRHTAMLIIGITGPFPIWEGLLDFSSGVDAEAQLDQCHCCADGSDYAPQHLDCGYKKLALYINFIDSRTSIGMVCSRQDLRVMTDRPWSHRYINFMLASRLLTLLRLSVRFLRTRPSFMTSTSENRLVSSSDSIL